MDRIETYLSQLNDPQREAVLENSHPLLVLAGAGSGKTRVITTKIAYAIDRLGCKPWEILAVTFTNKAATEMRQRVASMLPEVDVSDMHIRTFHAFGAWLLRRHGQRIGLGRSFTIYDDADSLSLLASCWPGAKKTELSPVSRAIALAKDQGLNPASAELADFRHDPQFPPQFRAYETRLREVGNVDFADLINRSIELLTLCPDVAQELHRRFRIVLVDEYQDSNIAQFNLLKRLVGPKTFVCVVGDDDQSIYRFRGAEVKNILSFPDVYSGTRIIKLEQNYRSTGTILAIAGAVIARNTGRHPKTLWTANGEGGRCRVHRASDEREEAMHIASLLGKDGNYDGSAILYRTNAQSSVFETVFARMNIPFKVVGALRFFDREEIKDALALLSLLVNPSDPVAFKRMVNKPSRGIGDMSVEKIINLAKSGHIDLVAALEQASVQGLLAGKAASGARDFVDAVKAGRDALDNQNNAACLQVLLSRTGLHEHYRQMDLVNRTDKVDNLGMLVSEMGEYGNGRDALATFLESLMLDPTTIGRKDPSKQPGVTLITMHNTKGLEFDRVFIAGMEEGLFPGRQCESDDDLEEERRIFYVAITRARTQLHMSYCAKRTLWGKVSDQMVSRFMAELPKDRLVYDNDATQSRSGYRGFGALGEKRLAGSFQGRNPRNSNIVKSESREASVAPASHASAGHRGPTTAYRVGDAVFHEQYGEGEVRSIHQLRDRQMVDVRFATGKAVSFFADSALLEKLGSF